MATKKTTAKKTTTKKLTMPTVPELKFCLVAVVDQRVPEAIHRFQYKSTDKVRRVACAARDLSQKSCFFCGVARPKAAAKISKKAQQSWENYQLCKCLGDLRQGYREAYPGWLAKTAEIVADVRAKKLDPHAEIFRDNCTSRAAGGEKCGKEFIIRARHIVNAVERFGAYNRSTRCFNCMKPVREARDRARAAAAAAKVAAPTHAAVPPKRAPRSGPLKVRLGDLVQTHEAERLAQVEEGRRRAQADGE